MADGLDRDQWLHTATMLAKLHNVNITDEKQIATLADFYPFAKKAPRKPMDEEERQTLLARIAATFPKAKFDIKEDAGDGKPSIDD